MEGDFDAGVVLRVVGSDVTTDLVTSGPLRTAAVAGEARPVAMVRVGSGRGGVGDQWESVRDTSRRTRWDMYGEKRRDLGRMRAGKKKAYGWGGSRSGGRLRGSRCSGGSFGWS